MVPLHALTESRDGAVHQPAGGPGGARRTCRCARHTRWSISARFGVEVFRNGMDPLSIARYLAGMGTVVGMHCSIEDVRPW